MSGAARVTVGPHYLSGRAPVREQPSSFLSGQEGGTMSLNVLLLPTLGSGHLRSLIEARNRLVSHGTSGGDDHLG